MSAFKQVIQNEAELREILGYAGKAAQNKVLSEIDDICRAFIEKSPFVLLGSTDANGSMDVSPKGDPAGFVQVMDSKTLLIPDRPDNQRGGDIKLFNSYYATSTIDMGIEPFRRIPRVTNCQSTTT